MFYSIHEWTDENVNKICANQITIQEFFEKCRPDIPPELRQELFYYYFHDYFHDHKFRIPLDWIEKQTLRSDSKKGILHSTNPSTMLLLPTKRIGRRRDRISWLH